MEFLATFGSIVYRVVSLLRSQAIFVRVPDRSDQVPTVTSHPSAQSAEVGV